MIEQPVFFTSFLSVGRELLFYVAMLIFVLYASMLVYHWFSYGTERATAMLSLSIFLIVSAPLFIVMSLTL